MSHPSEWGAGALPSYRKEPFRLKKLQHPHTLAGS